MYKKIISTLVVGFSALPALALDMGVQGNTWPIVEVDMRQMMLESASKVDMSKVQDELKDSTDRYFDNLPRRILPSAERTYTRYIDPSITLDSDIQAPVADSAGAYQWQTLFAKGTRVNPLASSRPLTAMLYFDGTSEEQLKFVRAALSANPMRIVPVETAGANVRTLSKGFGRPIYYANDLQMSRFKVTQLPALLYPGSGEYSLYLALTAFASPYVAGEVAAVWPLSVKLEPNAPGPVPVPSVTAADRAALDNLLKSAFKKKPNEKAK